MSCTTKLIVSFAIFNSVKLSSLSSSAVLNANEPTLETANNAVLEVRQSSSSQQKEIVALLLHGSYSKAGPQVQADGNLLCLPLNECGYNDEDMMMSLQDQWIGIIFYSPESNKTSNDNLCISVFDRVKRAMIFGASAIILLSINPNILKEIDVSEILKKPLIIVKDIDNITVLLNAIKSKMKLKLRITYGKSVYDTQTFTIWSACWRARPGSGVVCRSDHKQPKVDPGIFWSYFYSILAIIILLLILKSNQRNDSEDIFERPSNSVAQLAHSLLRTKRYRKIIHNQEDRDKCAICLDLFHYKQKLRVLPCNHEFHTGCVDQWLCIHFTCPLCKHSINAIKEN